MKASEVMRSGLSALVVLTLIVLVGCGSVSNGDHLSSTDISVQGTSPEDCGQCHNQNFNHLEENPEGDSIFEDYSGSPHATAMYTFPNALCSRCHTDEGARAYISVVNGTESPSELSDALYGFEEFETTSNVQCRTCHDGTLALLGEQAVGLPGGWSAEFKTCTACHQLLKSDGTLNEAYHEQWSADRTITDTHYDDPSTPQRDGGGNVVEGTGGIEGYNIDPASGRSCRNCHNVHDADVSINREWAQSGHGDVNSDPWIHYDWKQSTGGFSGTGRQACQRCHTATGFKNRADNPATYDADGDGLPDKLNEYSITGAQAEVLYCWACHTDNAGGLRDPGAVTVDYKDATVTYADVSGSNICMACHTGRMSGDSIKNSSSDFTNKSFINSHNLVAGGTLFAMLGYEFEGQDYENVNYYKHDIIGTDQLEGDELDTGSNGPCVGCHMAYSTGHMFSPVEKNDSGHIVSILANDKLCSQCHRETDYGDYTLTPEMMNEEAEGFEDALAALEAALADKGFEFLGHYPYFANKDWTTVQDPTGKNNMGAAFNFNMLEHEPGAYAHNRYYASRLIFDSIDWVDSGTMEGTIDLSGFENAYSWIYNGTDPITAVKRP